MNMDDQVGYAHHDLALSRVLTLGREVEQLAERFLSTLVVSQDDDEQLLMFSMSVRCINFFRAILCLAPDRLAHPMASCVRGLIEQRWVFEAVAREATRKEAIRRLMEHEEYNRNRAVVNLRSLGQEERDQRITDEWLAEVQAGIDPDKSYHSLQRWAELAGRTSEYRTTYALLCNQMHPSFHAVDSHLLFDSDTRVRSVTVKADVQSLPLHLVQACEVMIDVIAACPEPWLTADIVSQATELRHCLGGLWECIPDPLLNPR